MTMPQLLGPLSIAGQPPDRVITRQHTIAAVADAHRCTQVAARGRARNDRANQDRQR
jgi:hypothetical protein